MNADAAVWPRHRIVLVTPSQLILAIPSPDPARRHRCIKTPPPPPPWTVSGRFLPRLWSDQEASVPRRRDEWRRRVSAWICLQHNVAVLRKPRNFFSLFWEKRQQKTYYKTKSAFVLAIHNYNVHRQCYLAVNVSCIANTNANFVL